MRQAARETCIPCVMGWSFLHDVTHELPHIPCVMGGSFLHDVTHELLCIPCVMGGSFLHDVTHKLPCIPCVMGGSFLHDVVHIPELCHLVLLPGIHLALCGENVSPVYQHTVKLVLS